MLTIPASRPSTTTGTCRTRLVVINTLRLSTESSGEQVATSVVMMSDTGRVSRSAPTSCSMRTTSRSDTMPSRPSGETTTIAPMLCTHSSVNRPATEVSGVIVATVAPLLRSTSDIRIELSAPRGFPHPQARQ